MVEVGHAPQGGGSPTEGSSPSSYERRGPTWPFASAGSDELGSALGRCAFPLFVWTGDGVARLANEAAAALLGEPLTAVVGHPMLDRFSPRDEVARVAEALFTGSLVGSQAKRILTRTDGEEVEVWVWTRVVELDGHLAAVSLVMPTSELASLGRDPATPWRDLVAVAIGIADCHWVMRAITHDVGHVFGYDVEQLLGRSFLDLVHPDSLGYVSSDEGGPPTSPITIPAVMMKDPSGSWVTVCLLVAPLPAQSDGAVIFAVVGPPPPSWSTAERVTELEMRLRRIGAEIRAAGVLENVSILRSQVDHPELTELTTRQWEILSLLLEGMRVPSIAARLYVSSSTVRNHLATIFRRFGVHSQAELLELLRSPPDEADAQSTGLEPT